jgi:hypothetical protein
MSYTEYAAEIRFWLSRFNMTRDEADAAIRCSFATYRDGFLNDTDPGEIASALAAAS